MSSVEGAVGLVGSGEGVFDFEVEEEDKSKDGGDDQDRDRDDESQDDEEEEQEEGEESHEGIRRAECDGLGCGVELFHQCIVGMSGWVLSVDRTSPAAEETAGL